MEGKVRGRDGGIIGGGVRWGEKGLEGDRRPLPTLTCCSDDLQPRARQVVVRGAAGASLGQLVRGPTGVSLPWAM